MLLLDSTEEVITLSSIREILHDLESEAEDKKLFHQIFIPFLGSINIDTMDIVQIVRCDQDLVGTTKVSKFTLRKAFIDSKFKNEPECVHLIFEFVRRLGFSTIDTIKVFCNDRIA